MEEVDGVLVAAHELKEPLMTLRQLALSLQNLDSTGEQIRTEMLGVSERALRQVEDLAKIRRLEDGLFEMEPVAVRSVCDDVVTEIHNLFKETNLAVRYSNRIRLAESNRELLRSVLYNFLACATHYAGGVSPRLLVRDEKDYIKILIRDYGPELPRRILERLKSETLTEPTPVMMRPGSSALGLYIASKFSHYMKAEVGAIRHRDGTSFYVALPASKQLSFLKSWFL